MAGMRSEKEILAAFSGLSKAPGSNRPRREVSELAKKRKEKVFDESAWDNSPMIKTIRGEEVELFTINALAKALDKKVVTIRLWEEKGYIPIAPYRLRSKTINGKKVNGARAYTRELIEVTIEEFERRGLLGTLRVEWTHHEDLTQVLVERWKSSLNPNNQNN
jgi:hypothetical protein